MKKSSSRPVLRNDIDGCINNQNERVCKLMIKRNEVTIHSSAAEYLTYVAADGDSDESLEISYEEENIC